jgi:hypothetical protein
VLRGILVRKREQKPGEWRKWSNRELHDLYRLRKTIRVNKLSRRRGTRHVARGSLVLEPKRCRRLGTQKHRRKIILKWTLNG